MGKGPISYCYYYYFFHVQCNHNQLDDWNALKELEGAQKLRTVYFEGNPFASDSQYRRKLQLALPTLTQIDATLVRGNL